MNVTATFLRPAGAWLTARARDAVAGVRRFPGRVHRDQRGAISVLSVFTVFMFTILLVLIVNVGRQIDDKLRMQNAADSAAYSGASVIARGMNAIAFSNHLECETFALVAYMREGRDRKSEKFIPEILEAWMQVGNKFATGTGTQANSQKFKLMGQAIMEKVPIEQAMVQEFSQMAFHESELTLPLFEYILAGPDFENSAGVPDRSPEGGFIPRFQRAVLQTVPYMAGIATDEMTQRYGTTTKTQHRNQDLRGLLWATDVTVVGNRNENSVASRTLPIIDPSRYGYDLEQVGETIPPNCPSCFSCSECISRKLRSRLAHQYLNAWIRHWMSPYFEYPDDGTPHYGAESAKMSNYVNFWRVYTCANLNSLLDQEYPHTNLPFIMRDAPTRPYNGGPPMNSQQTTPWDFDGCVQTPDHPERPCQPGKPITQQMLENQYTFVSAVYWPHQQPMFPGLFKNPLERDSRAYATAFAQSTVFLPRGRFSRVNSHARWPENAPWVHLYPCPPNGTCCANLYDLAPGQWDRYTLSNTNPSHIDVWWHIPSFAMETRWEQYGEWDSFNQNWTTKLVPATAANVPTILSQHPGVYLNGALSGYQPPPLQNIPQQTFHLVNTH
jgi:hypothetical protein